MTLNLVILPAGLVTATSFATPVAILPDWVGRPVRLRERQTSNGMEQSIDLNLAARGDVRGNLVLVGMRRAREIGSEDPTARMARPTAAGIRAELETAFPGVAMQVVTRAASNAYGPYGLAIGRLASGARCLYAWQWIENAEAVLGDTASQDIAIRVRICRDDITLEALAAAIDQLRLVRRGEGAPVASRASAIGPAKAARKRSHPQARISPQPSPPAGEALVGRPRAQESATRRHLGAEPSPRRTVIAERIENVPERGIRRSLAGLMKPDFVPSTSTSIGADLPAEAYRGPKPPATKP